MILRNIMERHWSYSFIHVAKVVYACFLLVAFCGTGNTGYAQFNFLKGNNTTNRSSATAQQNSQNKSSAQHKQNAQNAKTAQKGGTQALPQGNRNDQLLDATNNTAAMKTALQTIPWNRLPNPAKEKIQAVLSNKPLYRRLPQQSAYCEPIMYDFLLNHPDVVVAIWEKLGVTQISLKEHGRPGVYQLRETVGSTGMIEVLYKTRNYCIAYSKGSYTGPFLPKPVEGETVLILQNIFEQDEDGEPYVVTQLDAFVKVNNFGVDMFAKLFAPALGRIADSNFEQTIAFLGNVSEAAQTNPEVIKRLALRLESIRKEVRDEFIQTAYQTAQLAINRSDGLESNPYSRQLMDRQTAQTDRQRQEFDQERIRYLQNLHRNQQMLEKPTSASGRHQEMPEAGESFSRVNRPGALVRPNNTYTLDAMSPENDFSGNLEIIEKATPVLSKPAPVRVASKPTPGATVLNLDLDLDFGTDIKPVPASATSGNEKSKSEQTLPILDLNSEASGLEASKQNATPKTMPKTVAVEPVQASPSQPAPRTSTSSGKTGVVFGTPTIK